MTTRESTLSKTQGSVLSKQQVHFEAAFVRKQASTAPAMQRQAQAEARHAGGEKVQPERPAIPAPA